MGYGGMGMNQMAMVGGASDLCVIPFCCHVDGIAVVSTRRSAESCVSIVPSIVRSS